MASNRVDLSDALWFRSSYSNGDGGECVEVAGNLPGIVPVRDSKAPDGPVLTLRAAAWAPFVAALKERHGVR
ncbi:DUF397 domain-containing protein [Streptomyces sp. TG1A-8]|uniref:DUF397 domain-containing protein n=1 Tax=Streptomyces sp. TG1A-8 TaxID=3051385 RepID=UPI00265BF94B|nr:DUF397 domain-containing protein [Streptomyces sp. TG1A-8]MDO0927986.1 DUF397 domain-containing protein [Streptomyces sp. TG1A-8]